MCAERRIICEIIPVVWVDKFIAVTGCGRPLEIKESYITLLKAIIANKQAATMILKRENKLIGRSEIHQQDFQNLRED